MAYDPKNNKQNYKYRRGKYKRVSVDVEKDFFETRLKPAADAEGVTVGRYVKDAVAEKLARDGRTPVANPAAVPYNAGLKENMTRTPPS